MLSSILAKSDCATCKFCCSFRRQSLWETPVFDEATMNKLQKLYPNAKFRIVGKSGKSYTFDISDAYKTEDPEEEAPCPFLDAEHGCALPPELKPFDCKIWPLRVINTDAKAGNTNNGNTNTANTNTANTDTGTAVSATSTLAIALTPTCPAINRQPIQKVRDLAASGLGQKILDYAAENPDIIKEATGFLSNIIYIRKQ